MRVWSLVWLVAAGLGTALLAPAQESLPEAPSVMLVPRFTAGERVRYRMTVTVETRSRLEPMGTSATNADPLRRVFDLTWLLEVVEVDPDGSARLRATIEVAQIESSPPAPAPPKKEGFVGKSIAYRQTAEGRVEDLQAPPDWLEDGKPAAWLRSWLEQGSQSGSGVHRRPIRLGESWQDERDIEVPGLPRQRLRATSTYTRDGEVNGVPCAAVVTRLALSGTESREEINPDGSIAILDSRAEGSGSRLSCFDLASARPLESIQTIEETFRVGVRRGTDKQSAGVVLLLETQTKVESRLWVVY